MDISEIILAPLLTEKSSALTQVNNQYSFKVARKSNKTMIKSAIEKRFKVKVKKVSTINVKGKTKNMSVKSSGHVLRTSGKKASWKKALVTLDGDHKIDLVGGEY
jgi:large subunit ribosomal protein L23